MVEENTTEENTTEENTDEVEETPVETFDVNYACLRCATVVSNTELSRLPEISLEPLFFDTYSVAGELDQECVIGSVIGYYLYGVQQNLPNLKALHFYKSLSLYKTLRSRC